MERLLKPYDKESMKMAMLKHEEIFKEQVCELHRVYLIQKTIMKNMKNSDLHGCSLERRNLENEIHARQVNEGEDEVLEIEEEINVELTLGLTSYKHRKKDETSLTSESGPSISSSSSNESRYIQESNRIHKNKNIREELKGYEWRELIQITHKNPSFPSERKNISDVEGNLNNERLKQPPWMFHVLSLNMT